MVATKIDNIYVDAVKRLTPSAPLRVSSYTIESGAEVAGYVAEGEETVTMDVYFADDNLVTYPNADMEARAAARVTSAADKRTAILNLKKERRLVSIIDPDEKWTNMLLIEDQRDKTAKNRKGFEATLVFQKIETQTLGTAAVPLDRLRKKSAKAQEGAAKNESEQDQGKVDAPEVETGDVAQSLWDRRKDAWSAVSQGSVPF